MKGGAYEGRESYKHLFLKIARRDSFQTTFLRIPSGHFYMPSIPIKNAMLFFFSILYLAGKLSGIIYINMCGVGHISVMLFSDFPTCLARLRRCWGCSLLHGTCNLGDGRDLLALVVPGYILDLTYNE